MPDPAEIERIIQEVVRRICSDGTPRKVSLKEVPSPEESVAGARVQRPALTLAKLTLAERLITLESIEGRLRGVGQLVVSSSAVVTPAVLDALRNSRVQLVRESGKLTSPAAAPLVLLGMGGVRWDVNQLGQSAERFVTPAVHGDCPDVLEQLCTKIVAERERAVLLTDQAHAAAWLANQQFPVRAAVAHDTTSVHAAATQLGANLLVVNPAAQSGFRTVAMLRSYASDQNQDCPATWRDAARRLAVGNGNKTP